MPPLCKHPHLSLFYLLIFLSQFCYLLSFSSLVVKSTFLYPTLRLCKHPLLSLLSLLIFQYPQVCPHSSFSSPSLGLLSILHFISVSILISPLIFPRRQVCPFSSLSSPSSGLLFFIRVLRLLRILFSSHFLSANILLSRVYLLFDSSFSIMTLNFTSFPL